MCIKIWFQVPDKQAIVYLKLIDGLKTEISHTVVELQLSRGSLGMYVFIKKLDVWVNDYNFISISYNTVYALQLLQTINKLIILIALLFITIRIYQHRYGCEYRAWVYSVESHIHRKQVNFRYGSKNSASISTMISYFKDKINTLVCLMKTTRMTSWTAGHMQAHFITQGPAYKEMYRYY